MTSRIYFDPEQERIVSRTADGDSVIYGVWSQEGDRWIVESTARTDAGKILTAKYVMTPVGEDAFKIESVERSLDDQALEDVPETTVKRMR